MTKITTDDCKTAIVDYVMTHPGVVSKQFTEPVCEDAASHVKNWKRETKEKNSIGLWVRTFACRAYGDGDALRAYVAASDSKIVSVLIQGE